MMLNRNPTGSQTRGRPHAHALELSRAFARALVGWIALGALTACAPMMTPVLRHETGDILPPKRIRVHGEFERAMQYPIPPQGSDVEGVPQESQVFQGTNLSVGAAMGVHPRAELQLTAFFIGRGAGWRLGAKTPIRKLGPLSIAGLVRYGTYSGNGVIRLATYTGVPQDLDYTLSAKQFDIGVPVSMTMDIFTFYTGLALLRTWVKGSADSSAVADSSYQTVWNLGVRTKIAGPVELDAEVAFARFKNVFTDSMEILPFAGVGVGVVF